MTPPRASSVDDPHREFLEIFHDEANGRLDEMVESLLEVEGGRAGPEAVDGLFRNAHTIKGAAAMLGLDGVSRLAHALEDVLAAVRDADVFPPDLVEPLLRAADALRLQVRNGGDASPELLKELAAAKELVAAAGGTASPKTNGASIASAAGLDRRAVRVPAEKLDHLLDLVGETVLHRRRLDHVLGGDQESEGVTNELGLGDRLLAELQDAAVQMRTLPLASITGPLPRAVRDIGREEGKQVELLVSGAETELDRVILEGLSDPLVHLLRNAVAHGIEPAEERRRAGKPATGRIELRAEQRGGGVVVTVVDDGRGVPADVLAEAHKDGSLVEVLCHTGFTTSAEVNELSGRGVGLDAVRRHVVSLAGTLAISSTPGEGTTVTMHLPLTLALLDVLLVERGPHVFGLPLPSVEEAVTVTETLSLQGRPAFELRGRSLPLADLADLVGADAPPPPERPPALIVNASGRRVAAVCDRLLGEQEVVVKDLGPLLASATGYLGAAILGDGRIALLLDPAALVRAPGRARTTGVADTAPPQAPKVLVVEDSLTVRELQRSILEAAGYRVATARDGKDALAWIARDDEIDVVVTDIEMPEMDGLELTQAIRSGQDRPSLPVIVVTTRGSDEDRRRGIEAGADAYMVKRSFDQQALLETVERLVGR